MDRRQVMEMFNRRPRIGTLSTANRNGDVNVAVFGSPQMIDEETVVMGIGENRSLAYLRENPKAVFIVMEPGETPMDWKGCRVYLTVDSLEGHGELLGSIRSKVAEAAGEAAAQMIRTAVRFKVEQVRELIAAP